MDRRAQIHRAVTTHCEFCRLAANEFIDSGALDDVSSATQCWGAEGGSTLFSLASSGLLTHMQQALKAANQATTASTAYIIIFAVMAWSAVSSTRSDAGSASFLQHPSNARSSPSGVGNDGFPLTLHECHDALAFQKQQMVSLANKVDSLQVQLASVSATRVLL